MNNNGRVLLVEGENDKHVVLHLCKLDEEMPEFCILDKGGIEKLLEAIGSEVRVHGRKAVGILVDANDDLNARWGAVADRLREEDIAVPNTPEPTGTLINGSNRTPRVGIWLMPDNKSPGELENFVSEMIPAADPIWPRSQCYIDDIPEADRKFKKKKILRAKIYAWLATRENPRQMGAAIGAGGLHTDGTLCKSFADWLRQLFE